MSGARGLLAGRTARLLGGLGVAAALAGLAATASAAPPRLAEKRAEAARVLAEVQALDTRLEKAVEAYDYASYRLAGIGRDLRVNTHDLAIARGNLRFAQHALDERLVSLYQQGDAPTGLAIVLGASSMSDALDRLEAAQQLSSQDAVMIRQVRTFRSAVSLRQRHLVTALATQARLVRRRAAERGWIEGQLSLRRRLLSTIQDEVARLQAQQRAEEERLRQIALARMTAAAQAPRSLLAQGAPQDPAAALGSGNPLVAPLAPPAPPSDRYADVVPIAMRYLGVPYVWAGASPSGFDCSGLVMYVYAQVGVSLPHNAAAQYQYGTPVPLDQLEPGDLVFFEGLGHVALYVGGGLIIHAPQTGDVVRLARIDDPWFRANAVGARRL